MLNYKDNQPFFREVNQSDKVSYLNFIKKISPIYNYKNFEYIYVEKIFTIIHLRQYKFLINYIFEMLKRWVLENEKYNFRYSQELNNLIDYLKIRNYLNLSELAYLEKLDGVIFSMQRKLKKLIPHFKLNKKESAFFFYDENILKFDSVPNAKPVFGDISITNERMAFIFSFGIYHFFWKELKILSLKNQSVYFNFGYVTFSIESTNPEILYTSIDRILKVAGYST